MKILTMISLIYATSVLATESQKTPDAPEETDNLLPKRTARSTVYTYGYDYPRMQYPMPYYNPFFYGGTPQMAPMMMPYPYTPNVMPHPYGFLPYPVQEPVEAIATPKRLIIQKEVTESPVIQIPAGYKLVSSASSEPDLLVSNVQSKSQVFQPQSQQYILLQPGGFKVDQVVKDV